MHTFSFTYKCNSAPVPFSSTIFNYLTDVGQIPNEQSSSSSNRISGDGSRGQLKQGAPTNICEVKINAPNSCNPLCYLPEPRARQFTKQSLQTVHLPTFEAYIRGKTTPLAMPTKEDMTYKMCKAS